MDDSDDENSVLNNINEIEFNHKLVQLYKVLNVNEVDSSINVILSDTIYSVNAVLPKEFSRHWKLNRMRIGHIFRILNCVLNQGVLYIVSKY